MTTKVDLYDSTYTDFEAAVLARVRAKTFGQDIGQNSWTTADEYRRWNDWLELRSTSHVLEVASGSGGPAMFLATLFDGRVTGIDFNPHGISQSIASASARGISDRVDFQHADASARLPFPDSSFDAIICIDAMNHLPDRLFALKEWNRVLKPGGRALFTDPVVITGLVSSEELAARSSVGFFAFAPPGTNERLIAEVGFELARQEDVTANAAEISKRWHDARAEDREALVKMEGEERFAGLQKFFAAVHRLSDERRLSRFAYLARKRS